MASEHRYDEMRQFTLVYGEEVEVLETTISDHFRNS